MKSVLMKIACATLACLLLFALAGCAADKSEAVEKAFTDEGYSVSKAEADNETVQGLLSLLLNEEQRESVSEYEIMLCVPDGLLNIANSAIVIKFPSAGDLKDFLTVEKDGALIGPVDASQRFHQGGLTGTVGTDNCIYLTPKNIQIHPFERLGGPKGFVDVSHLQNLVHALTPVWHAWSRPPVRQLHASMHWFTSCSPPACPARAQAPRSSAPPESESSRS